MGFVFALAGAAAAQPATDLDAPIATGAPEMSVSQAGPSAPLGVQELPNPAGNAAGVRVNLLEPVESREADASARRPGDIVQLDANTALVARRSEAVGPTGGFLAANPQFEKRNRRTVGFALRF